MSAKYPAGTPSWIKSALTTLAMKHELHGVTVGTLASISYYTSKWGETGIGINPQGFGGYFGQHYGWNYPGGANFTAAQLKTPSPTQFKREAIAASASLASYGSTLRRDLNTYASGHPTQTSAFTSFVLSGSGVTPKMKLTASNSTTPNASSTTSVSVGSLMGAPFSLNKSLIIRAVIAIVGIIVLIVALKELTADHGPGETAIAVPEYVQTKSKKLAKSSTETASVAAA